jgi:undecaprenyl-diphosphatase
VSVLEAVFLGIIQGATEFLPISSSGHLLIVPSLLNLSEPDLNAVSIAHLGTLVAILIYFRLDLWQIARSWLAALADRRPLGTPDARLGWYIIIGTIPAAVAGLLLEETLAEIFGQPVTAAFLLFVTAAVLVFAERLQRPRKGLAAMTWTDAVAIGLAQAIALLPGVSRSGMTISAGMTRRLDRPAAARFSFLLGVPAIAGAGLLAVLDLAASGRVAGQVPALLASFVAAGFVGYACIHFLLAWLRSHTLYPFAVYCATFAALFLLVTWLRA